MAANAPIHVFLIDELPLRLHTAHYNKQSVSTQSHSQAPVFQTGLGMRLVSTFLNNIGFITVVVVLEQRLKSFFIFQISLKIYELKFSYPKVAQ